MKFFPLLFFILLIGCTTNKAEKAKGIYVPIESAQIVSKLYSFGPLVDTLNCQATGGCDCCMDHIWFVNGKDFIRRLYCVEGDDIVTGEYQIKGNKIILNYDSASVSAEYNFEHDIEDTIAIERVPKFNLKVVMLPSDVDTLYASLCHKKLMFTQSGGESNERFYGLQDAKETPKHFKAQLVEDGIQKVLDSTFQKVGP